jgi:hypothetical protein
VEPVSIFFDGALQSTKRHFWSPADSEDIIVLSVFSNVSDEGAGSPTEQDDLQSAGAIRQPASE